MSRPAMIARIRAIKICMANDIRFLCVFSGFFFELIVLFLLLFADECPIFVMKLCFLSAFFLIGYLQIYL